MLTKIVDRQTDGQSENYRAPHLSMWGPNNKLCFLSRERDWQKVYQKYIFASFDQIDRKTDRQTDRHVQNNITSLIQKRDKSI